MKICFIGHKIIYGNIEARLEKTVEDLIERYPDAVFYLGDHGQFDRLAQSVLQRLRLKHPTVRAILVLSYMPTASSFDRDSFDTLFPEDVARAHPRYAIDRRNHWVIQNSDIVITYVVGSCGGAARFKRIAISRKKAVIEIGE